MLTRAEKEAYIAKPTYCPYCHSDNIVAVGNSIIDHDMALQNVKCDDCGRTWDDCYKLASILEEVRE